MLSGMNRARDAVDHWADAVPAICLLLILLILAIEAATR